MPYATRRTRRHPKPATALDVLKSDHAEAKKLFTRFEKAKRSEDRAGMEEIARAACKALRIHAQIEEEIFYPALRQGADAEDALDEADVEHGHIKELVMELEGAQPGDELFAARFTVLSEYVQHHVKEEESTIFAKARKAGCDLVALGEQLAARKAMLGAYDDDSAVPEALVARKSRARNGQRVTR